MVIGAPRVLGIVHARMTSHQGQHDEFLFLFRDDDDDGVVESRTMIFTPKKPPAVPPLWLLIH